jgi:hypothetical protein
MALGFGRYRYANRKGDPTDYDALRRRDEAERRNAAEGLETCWKCLTGVKDGAAHCPGCGMTDPTGVPF